MDAVNAVDELSMVGAPAMPMAVSRASLARWRRRFAQEPLGEILVRQGVLGEAQRERALVRQQRWHQPFGQCCLRLHLINRRQLQRALESQFGCLVPASEREGFAAELSVLAEPDGAFAEGVRRVADRLLASPLRPGQNVVAVLSPTRRDGRSRLAANLALVCAQTGRRTLLVDGDLRHPRLHHLFGVSQHPGLSRSLCGFVAQTPAHRFAGLASLTLLTAGPLPPNPLELLVRETLDDFLSQAGRCYEVVLLDTPAAAGHGDAERLARAAGQALLLARRQQSRLQAMQALVSALSSQGVGIMGTVLNAAD